MTTNRMPITTADSSEVTFFDAKAAKAVDLLALRDTSIIMQEAFRRIATAATRHVLRDEPCDMIPRLEGLFALPKPNEYGDSFLLEATYAKRGYRASYGGKWDADKRHIIWTCYMD